VGYEAEPSRITVHPHVRGEHKQRRDPLDLESGSSPRAWGTRPPVRLGPFAARFIPTCVGNTIVVATCPPAVTVHPHVRGEHFRSASTSARNRGSSPRAWGTPAHVAEELQAARFIPTCVGNTLGPAWTWPAAAVHPHVRGEHGRDKFLAQADIGSSPRAWGTHFTPECDSFPCRFIPTCVGNTSPPAPPGSPGAVHPHVRGEHASTRLNNDS